MQLLAKFQGHSSSTSEVIGYCSEPPIPKFGQNRDFSTLSKYNFWSKQLWAMIFTHKVSLHEGLSNDILVITQNHLWRHNFDDVIIRTCVVWAGILGDRNEFGHYNWYYGNPLPSASLSNKSYYLKLPWHGLRAWIIFGTFTVKMPYFAENWLWRHQRSADVRNFFLPIFGNSLLGTICVPHMKF